MENTSRNRQSGYREPVPFSQIQPPAHSGGHVSNRLSVAFSVVLYSCEDDQTLYTAFITNYAKTYVLHQVLTVTMPGEDTASKRIVARRGDTKHERESMRETRSLTTRKALHSIQQLCCPSVLSSCPLNITCVIAYFTTNQLLWNYDNILIIFILEREVNSVLPTAGIPEVHKYGPFSISSIMMGVGIKPGPASNTCNSTTLLLGRRKCIMQTYIVI